MRNVGSVSCHQTIASVAYPQILVVGVEATQIVCKVTYLRGNLTCALQMSVFNCCVCSSPGHNGLNRPSHIIKLHVVLMLKIKYQQDKLSNCQRIPKPAV